jgi:outer membrane protein assembly factor BamB
MRARLGWGLLIAFGAVLLHVAAAGRPDPRQNIPPLSLSDPLRLAWQFPSTETTALSPSASDLTVYLPLSDGVILALDPATGRLRWREMLGGSVSADTLATPTSVFVANEITGSGVSQVSAKGALRALSADTGLTLWMRTLPYPVRGGMAQSDGILYVLTLDKKVMAIRANNGEVVWYLQLSDMPTSRILATDARLFFGTEDGSLYCLERSTGNTIWRYRTHGAISGRPAVSGSDVIFGSADGFVYCNDIATGKKLWDVRTGAGVQSVDVADGRVIAASLDNFVYGFTLSRGGRVWKKQLEGRPLAEPLVLGSHIMFFPISGSGAVVLDAHDGKVVNRFPTGDDNSTAAAPVMAGENLILTTRTGIMAFSRGS